MKRQTKKTLQRSFWPSLEGKVRAWFVAKWPVLWFGLKFGGIFSLFYCLLALPFFENAFYSYLVGTAWVSNLILSALGQGTHVSEVTITSANFAIAIRRGCDAIEPTWLLCAAIFAFPGLFVRKLVGISVGIILLQVLNLVRIVSLFWIGRHFPALFSTAHLEIWPMIFILMAISLFVGWRGWACAR